MAKRAAIELAEEGRNFLPIIHNTAHMQGMIQENLGGEELSAGDLERAINPSGKSTKWTFEDIDGTEELVDSIEGVIIHSSSKRVLYLGEYKGGGEEPDCYSDDGIHGHGAPADKCGGLCANCPLQEFGSGKNNSKACSDIKRIWILREGDMLPTIVNATPINKRALRKYGVTLSNKRGRKLSEVISKLELSTAKSKSGYDYAKLRVTLVEELNEVDREKMAAYADTIRPILDSSTVRDESFKESYGTPSEDTVDVTPAPPTDDLDSVDF